MTRGLLIEFDLSTGKRAGNINPRDPKLPCHGWQNLEREPAIEIRLVEDDRDLSQYVGVSGVTILEGKETINKALEANIPARYKIESETLLLAHLKEKNIPLNSLAGKKLSDIAKELYAQNLAGISERKPKLV